MKPTSPDVEPVHPQGATNLSPDGARRSLSGWGGWPKSVSEVVHPVDPTQLIGIQPSSAGYIPRGLGRSYGDAAQIGGGTVIDMTGLNEFSLDDATGLLTAHAGTALGDILAATVPRGWFLPVVPGTKHVTLGGAIAADVHGKNHHRDGSFGSHVLWCELVTSDRRVLKLTPGTEEFEATTGGMGLTGTISRVAVRLVPIESEWMTVDTETAPDIVSVMDRLVEIDEEKRYSVAWLDVGANKRGRGVVMGGDHARMEELPERTRRGTARQRGGGLSLPRSLPGVINEATVRAFNGVWYARAPRRESGRVQSHDSFFFPLDRISGWNRLYGKRGFLQYQFVVPDDESDTVLAVAERLARSGAPVALAVLKRMGASGGGPLSFPMPGWTLALDLPLGDPSLSSILDECDDEVAMAGGKVYLAKDSRLRAGVAREMYQMLPAWREVRSSLDPPQRLRSNLSQRLGLTG
jgi:decaprenylphospho-beta-D-ribofuranose 2-oxidase